MERLTKRCNGVVTYIGTTNVYDSGQIAAEVDTAGVREVLERLAAYEDTGLTPDQASTAKVLIDAAFAEDAGKMERIRELMKADEDRRVVVLPCKVGQRVFALLDEDKHIGECEVEQFGLGHGIGFACIEPIDARGRKYSVLIEGFGKTVFLTREEAEKALEARKDG